MRQYGHRVYRPLSEAIVVAGEVMNIDAAMGGYDLRAAFSTGWLAGRDAASAILEG